MNIVKIIELVGCSENSWQEAIENALKKASETIRNIRGVDVLGWTGKVKGNKIIEYRANVKISFRVDEEKLD